AHVSRLANNLSRATNAGVEVDVEVATASQPYESRRPHQPNSSHFASIVMRSFSVVRSFRLQKLLSMTENKPKLRKPSQICSQSSANQGRIVSIMFRAANATNLPFAHSS